MKMKKTLNLILILSVILLLFTCNFAYAYNTFNGHILTGGINDKPYYNGATGYWKTPYNNSFNNWYNTSTSFYFYETTNISDARIECYSYSNLYDGLNGYTELYVPGIGLTQNSPTDNWAWARVHINTASLASTSADFDNGVAGHEIGHAIGLAHNFGDDVLMNTHAGGRTVTKPQQDDIDGVNSLY